MGWNVNDVQADKLFDRAIDLLINEDRNVDSWVTRYVGVESALVVGAAVIIGWQGGAVELLRRPLITALAVLGALFALLFAGVIERHLAWQRAYVEAVREIQGTEPLLFREGVVSEGLRVSVFVCVTKWVLVVL